jgi:dihydroorotase
MEKLFANCKSIIAIHSEKEEIVETKNRLLENNMVRDVPVKYHQLLEYQRLLQNVRLIWLKTQRPITYST